MRSLNVDSYYLDKYNVDYNYCLSIGRNKLRKFFRCLDVLMNINESLNFNGCQTWLEISSILGAVRNGRCIPWKTGICLGILFDSYIEPGIKKKFELKHDFCIPEDPNPSSLIKKGVTTFKKHWKHVLWESKLFEKYNLIHIPKYVCNEISDTELVGASDGPSKRMELMKKEYDQFNYDDISFLNNCIHIKYHSVFDGYKFIARRHLDKIELQRNYQAYDPNWYMTYAISPDNNIFNVSQYIYNKHRWWGIEFYDRYIIDDIIYYTKRIGPPNDKSVVLPTYKHEFHNMLLNMPKESILILKQLYGDCWREPKHGNEHGALTKYWTHNNCYGYLNLEGYDFFEDKDYFVSGLIKTRDEIGISPMRKMKDFIKSSIDRIELYDEPCFHGLCDNFLPEDLFLSLLDISGNTKKWPVPTDGRISKNKNIESRNILNSYMDSWQDSEQLKLILDKFDVTLDCWRQKWNVNSLNDLRVLYSFRKFGPGFGYKPHTDVSSKGITIVIYIYPDNADKYLTHNLGTVLYRTKDKVISTDNDVKHRKSQGRSYSYCGSVRWVSNRAFVFSAISNKTKVRKTWHSYNVPKYVTQGRVTLMINIVPKTAQDP